MKARIVLLALSLSLGLAAPGEPQSVWAKGNTQNLAQPESDACTKISKMPVREVTVFKDGHALVDHEGVVPVGAHGEVLIDDLPKPVLGTFFPYSATNGVAIHSVTAGKRKVDFERTALSIPELISANIGAAVKIELLTPGENTAKTVFVDGEIAGIPTRSAEEQARAISSGADGRLLLPQKSNLVEVKTESGLLFIPVERIQTISFKSKYSPIDKNEELRNLLTLKLSGASKNATIGMMYLENGMRFIPSYKVVLDGSGKAKVTMQATLVNDLIDMEDVTTNLVIGVPSFAFKGEVDPIALSGSLAAVAAQADYESRLRNNFSNAIMSQVAYSRSDDSVQSRDIQMPAAPDGSKNEDLFVFTIKHVSLKKGERMVLPVREFTLEYKDVYSLALPTAPPAEITGLSSSDEPSRADEALKVMHKIRLFNSTKEPLTTAPAMILLDQAGKTQILSQSMMTYASPTSSSELTLTAAVDIKAKKNEHETHRQPDAANFRNNSYCRVDLDGKLTLTNYSNKPVQLEVSRKILGKCDKVSEGGKSEMLSSLDEERAPFWSRFPLWWSQVNGVGKFSWTKELKPGETSDFDYSWHYFWR